MFSHTKQLCYLFMQRFLYDQLEFLYNQKAIFNKIK
uniref:Uncharacterized protein n=1 Tax=Anguilla anguilla TaxID=7936 RepID=A0A0E9S205_ANGAN